MLEKFYGDVLPRTGYLCLWTKHNKAHIWAEDQHELIHLTREQGARLGVYFGTASYHSHSRKQHNVRVLRSLRLDIDAGAAKFAKHPDGAYATQPEAIRAVVAFIKAANLMPTYIVSSGEGLHVYWCMDNDIAPGQWEPMAAALQAMGNAHGLRIDPTTTQDSARILRPIGTFHDNGHEVAVLKDTGRIWGVTALAEALAVALPVPVAAIQPAPAGKYDMSVNDDVRMQIVQRPAVSAIEVAAKCASLNLIARTGGDVPEPQWRGMLGLVKHTIEGEDLAHEWSMGYAEYDEAETQKKIEGWNAGPTTCAYFALHMKTCETCVYKGTVKSPVLLVEPPPATTVPQAHVAPVTAPAAAVAAPPARIPAPPPTKPWEARLPPSFEVRANTGSPGHHMVYMMPDDETEDGQPTVKPVPFSSRVFWMGHWAQATSSEDVARVEVYRLEDDGHVTSFTLNQDVLAVQRDLVRFLGGQNIQLTNHRKAPIAMHDYTRAALQLISQAGKRLQISDHLGMRITQAGDLIATQGEYTIFPDSRIEKSMISAPLAPVAAQFNIPLPHAGTYGEWQPDVWEHIEGYAKKHVAFLQKYYGGEGMERFQLAIMMGLASPFMPFVTGEFQSGSVLPRGGLSISLFSRESARGKTTAVQSAILAFGKPASLTNDGGRVGATELARIARLTIHGSLPNIMDEMGGATPQSVAGAINTVANGASRERGTKEGGLNISAPWALINLITTNTSQRDMIANVQESSDAIQQRLLEINVDGMPDHTHTDRHAFAKDWATMNNQCVGALGAVVHREICKMGLQKVTALTMACVEKADKLTGAKVAARFQYRGLGALLALSVVLKRVGIEVFPLPGIVEAFKTAHDSGQDFIAANVMPTDGLEILSKMLHDLQRHTLVTEDETRRVNGRPDIVDRMLNDRMPDVVHARHIRATGRTYLSIDAARAWCREHNVPESEVTKRAREEGIFRLYGDRGLSSEKYNLFKGMAQSTSTFIKCYSIDAKMLMRKLGQPDIDAPPAAVANVVPLHASESVTA